MEKPQRKILLVEDDPQLADALTAKFRHSPFELVHAATGQEGLRLLRTLQPDLMILDLMLPDVSGDHLLQLVRDEGTLPVVIISAKSEENERIQGLEAGADDYLCKPLGQRELVARVSALLRRTEPGPDEPSEEVDEILTHAREAEVAEEPDDRLACIIALKDALATAIESAHDREEEDYRDALVLIKWAAHNTYAEDMTPTQLHGLVEAVELLLADTVEQDAVWNVSRALREHHLDYIRPLASVEEEA
jgi:CheY-like chemotaxis protein